MVNRIRIARVTFIGLFTLSVPGVSSSAENVSQVRLPISLGVLVDAGENMGPMMSMVHGGFDAFLQTLYPADEVFMMAFSQNVAEVIDFTEDKSAVSRAFGRFLVRGQSTLHLTLQAALEKLEQKAKNERKVLLIISGGRITAADMGRTRGFIRDAKVKPVIHTIGVIINCGPCETAPKELAKLTGGAYGAVTELRGRSYTLGPAFQALAELIAAQK